MIRWLNEDYMLGTDEIHQLMGQCIEYDVGNVYDPAFTMVCKLKKSLLKDFGLKS